MSKVWAMGCLSFLAIAGAGACAASASEQPADGGSEPSGDGGPDFSKGGGDDSSGPFVFGDGGVGFRDGPSSSAAKLTVTVRDFKFYNANDPTTNPDFQNVIGDDHVYPASGAHVVGTIAEETLGADHKPVYKSATQTTTTHGKMFFDQWYNDVPGTNIRVVVPLALSRDDAGTYGYDSQVSGVPLSPSDPRKMWFPIDDGTPYATAFGNQYQAHNYSFTTELHTVFVYNGGESFSFSGDDDVFVFIDNRLVIDLGGVHSREQASIELDTLGLTKGVTYPLDLFNAERHTAESNLSFQTTLNLQPAAQ